MEELVDNFCNKDLFADLLVNVDTAVIDTLREAMCKNKTFTFDLLLDHLDLEALIALVRARFHLEFNSVKIKWM